MLEFQRGDPVTALKDRYMVLVWNLNPCRKYRPGSFDTTSRAVAQRGGGAHATLFMCLQLTIK